MRVRPNNFDRPLFSAISKDSFNPFQGPFRCPLRTLRHCPVDRDMLKKRVIFVT